MTEVLVCYVGVVRFMDVAVIQRRTPIGRLDCQPVPARHHPMRKCFLQEQMPLVIHQSHRGNIDERWKGRMVVDMNENTKLVTAHLANTPSRGALAQQSLPNPAQHLYLPGQISIPLFLRALGKGTGGALEGSASPALKGFLCCWDGGAPCPCCCGCIGLAP